MGSSPWRRLCHTSCVVVRLVDMTPAIVETVPLDDWSTCCGDGVISTEKLKEDTFMAAVIPRFCKHFLLRNR